MEIRRWGEGEILWEGRSSLRGVTPFQGAGGIRAEGHPFTGVGKQAGGLANDNREGRPLFRGQAFPTGTRHT